MLALSRRTPASRAGFGWIAGGAAASLLLGSVVALTLDVQPASAADPAPIVGVSVSDTFIAGEDLNVGITLTSAGPAAGNQYNLSLGVVIPEGVTVLGTGALGTPTIFPAAGATNRIIPGVYATVAGNCSVLGLEPAVPMPAAPNNNACQVPLGKQHLVFQNVSDLPEGATTSHTLTLRPDADVFPVGSTDLEVDVTAYTSSDERYIPLFPGSKGLALDDAATSSPGVAHLDTEVRALRITKSEPSPESELLRGVHEQTTTYTLQVHHTGEGDIENTTVIDFIPAGLEYLGLGDLQPTDNTTNANGTQGGQPEYPGAPSLALTPAPAPAPGTWQTAGERVETVIPTAQEVLDYGLVAGAVYTKVTWDLGTLLATTDTRDTTPGVAQVYAGSAGTPGLIEIRYRAGVPLFENTLDFGGATPDVFGEQMSNLDNNRGASTRHGHETGDDSAAPAKSYTNVAVASGEYDTVVTEDVTSHTIDAVDFRVVKEVDLDSFTQGDVARFTLHLATSEYTSASVPGPAQSPYQLLDNMADGLCAIFPVGTLVQHTPGNPNSSVGSPVPNLILGDPSSGTSTEFNSIVDWNAALAAADVATQCQWDPVASGADPTTDALEGAQLVAIAFDQVTGHFYVEFAIDPTTGLAANAEHDVVYSVRQNETYRVNGGDEGATSSGDSLENHVDLYGLTTSIPELAGVTSAGSTAPDNIVPGDVADGVWNASDDSSESLIADFSAFEKKVLQRSAGSYDTADIVTAPESDWFDAAPDPFTIGDEVWYRIKITPPSGTDVRNPKLTDFLPLGVEFDPVDVAPANGRPDNMWIVPSSIDGIGTCAPADAVEWLNTFVPFGPTNVNGNVLNFTLGSADCLNGPDRFLPLDTELAIYIKVTVTDVSAFGSVDLPENLAKYQQQNVDGDIFFLRDAASIELAQSVSLVKGIRDIDGVPAAGNAFNSNVDDLQVAQGDEVTYRLDVSAPVVGTTDYVIWDVLPIGIKRADIVGADAVTGVIAPGDATAATLDQTWVPGSPGAWSAAENALPGGSWEATVYDFGDYPADVTSYLRSSVADEERSIIVWTVSADVPGAIRADDSVDPAIPAALQGLTLGYTVTIPDGTEVVNGGGIAAQATQRYPNDAAIVQFSAINNAGGVTTPIVPEGGDTLSTMTAGDVPGAVGISDEETFDDSDVFLGDPSIDKRLVSTEIGSTTPDGNGTVGISNTDTANAQGVVVQGEYATYSYTATIPANSAVRDAKLSDDGFLRWTGTPNTPSSREVAYNFLAGSAVFNGPTPGYDFAGEGFTLVTATGDPLGRPGTLIFPAEYINDTNAAQVFEVQITVWVDDREASNTSYNPDFPDSKTLTNTARFAFNDPNSATPGTTTLSDTANVVYREPVPTLTKTVVGGTVGADGVVTFRLTAGNTTGRPALYDAVVLDCLPAEFTLVLPLPAGASVIAGGCTTTGSGATTRVTAGGGSGTLIEWEVGRINAGTSPTLDFQAEVTDTAGGGVTYTNRAQIVGQTLPDTVSDPNPRRGDRVTGASRDVTLANATLAKSVTTPNTLGSAPVGETVEYTLVTTLPANANFYDVELVDTLPTGLSYAGNPTINFSGFVANPSMSATPSIAGQTLTWTVAAPGDIAFHTAARTITITFEAQITDAIVSTTPRNSSVFSWNAIDGDDSSSRSTDPATADVTILNPALQIVKKVDTLDSITRNPDATFDYTLVVSQTAAGNTPAHNITVQDVVPPGIKVDTSQAALTGATFSNATNITNGLGGTITWQLTGPLHQQAGAGVPKSIELGYEASFVDSIDLEAADFPYTNVANVTHFESFGTDGREYDPPLTGAGSIRDTAAVTPLFPNVVPTKTVTTPVAGQTYGIAEEGQPFSWTLTIENEGLGIAEDVSVTDLLPKNWEYDGNAMISVDGGAAAALADPTLTPAVLAEGDQQQLVWSAAVIAAAGATPLAAGSTFVITFDAVPTSWALTDAGTGIVGNGVKVNPHTNTLSVTATDTTGADENGDGDYVGPQSTATAYIAEMDLLLDKNGIGGVTNSAAFDGLPVGTWIAGQGVATGYAQPQWEITVTNQGPDSGFGPFVINDTMPTLPAGVTVGTWSARYFSGPGDTTGTDLGTFAAGSGSFSIGTTTTRLLADGSDRIVLTANVTIDEDAYADALPATLTLENEASVSGRTYEDPNNLFDNEDSDSKDVEELADLSIAKVVTSTLPVDVGDTITWQLTVRNLGPSVSRSTVANPITITDAVPAGVENVTPVSNAEWAATLDDGSPIPAGGADFGDVIMWTYIGDEMAVGLTAAVSLSGTIITSHTGALTNSATVNPGDTPDPVTPNNTSEVPVTPDDTTEMRIDKTRVVDDGAGGWRQADPVTYPDDEFIAGDPVHYLITVTNLGPADARDVTVVDEVPTGLTYASHTSLVGTWSYTAGGTTSTGGPNPAWGTFTLTGDQLETDAPTVPATAFVITYDTDPTLTGAVVNWAEVTIDNWDPTDPTGPYDRDDDDTDSGRIVDLGIVKTHTGTGPFTPGTAVEYTLVVTNHGPSATNGVIAIEDSLPAGMSYVASSASVVVPVGTTAPASPEPALSGTDNRVLTWSLLGAADTFDLNATITVTFRALIDPLIRDSILLTNHAEVDGPDNEPVPDTTNPNEDDDAITTTATDATMTIVKTVAAGPWIAGTNVTYTLTITNSGPSAAPATVEDTLPTGLTLVSMSGTNWDCSTVVAGAGSGECEYFDTGDSNVVTQVLHPVGVSTITVVAAISPTVLTGTVLTNETELTWTDGDGPHTDDDDVPITVTTDADLGIVKDVITGAAGTVIPDPADATIGMTAWYRLQVTNYGPSDAVGPITVTDELPLGVTVPATLTTVGSWTVVPGAVVPGVRQTVTFTLTGGQLANTTADPDRGEAPVIEFEVDLDPSIADGTTLTNDAEVSSPTPDSDPSNNTDDADILAERLVDLGVVKSHPVDSNGQVVIDAALDFTIQVTNYGPSEASGITIVDTVPFGLEVTSVVGPVAGTDWTIDSIVLVDPSDVEAGAVVTATYAATLGVTPSTNQADPLVLSTIPRERAVGTSPNHVEVTGNEPEPAPDPNPNEDDDPLDVLPRVTFTVTKTSVGAFQVGKRGTYEITVSNSGPHDDPGVIVVEDVLPAGLTYYASPYPGVTVVGQTVTWPIPSLAVGDTETITLVVDVHQAAYPSVTNLATVTTPSELTPPSDVDDDDTVTVAEADPLASTGVNLPVMLGASGVLLVLLGLVVIAMIRTRRLRSES